MLGILVAVGSLAGNATAADQHVYNTNYSGPGSLDYATANVGDGENVIFDPAVKDQSIDITRLMIWRPTNFVNNSGGTVDVNMITGVDVVNTGALSSLDSGLTLYKYNSGVLMGTSEILLELGTIAGKLKINGVQQGYGVYVIDCFYDITFNNGFSGTIEAACDDVAAYAIYPEYGTVTINGDFGGRLDCTCTNGYAAGITNNSDTAIINGDISGTMNISGGQGAYGIISNGPIVVNGGVTGTINVEASSGGASGIQSSESISISEGISGSISATTSADTSAFAIIGFDAVNGGDADTPLLIADGGILRAESPFYAVGVSGRSVNLKVDAGGTIYTTSNGGTAMAVLSNGDSDDRVEFVAGSTIVGNIALFVGTDTLILSGNTGSTTLDGNIYFTEYVNVTGGNWTLNGNIFDDARLTVSGGALTLNGVYTHTGGTFVNAGTLTVDGSVSGNTTIGLNGALRGNGTFANLLNRGTVLPGHSIGTVTVTGNYVNAAGSTLEIEINDSGQSDRIDVTGTAVSGVTGSAVDGATGTATINGGTVSVKAETGAYNEGDTYTFLTADSGVSGTFDSVIDDLAVLEAVLVYGADYVQILLSTSGGDYDDEAATFNQHGVAQYLDAHKTGATGDFNTVLGQLNTLSGPNARLAFDAMSGQVFGSLSTLGIENDEWLLRLISHRLQARHMLKGLGYAANDRPRNGDLQYVSNCTSRRSACFSNWSPWFEGYGIAGRLAGDGNAHGMEYSTGGLAVGLERQLNCCTLLGIVGGYSSSYATLDDRNNRGSIDAGQTAVYLHRDAENSYATGIAAYSYNAYDTRRRIAFGNIDRTADANYNGNNVSFLLETGRNMFWSRLNVQPYAGLEYIQLHQNDFVESGADSIDIAIGGIKADAFRGLLGTRFVLDYALDNGRLLTLEGRAVWRHEFLNDNRIIDATFAGQTGSAFAIAGINVDRDAGIVGIGLSSRVSSGASIFVNYDALVSENYTAHAGSGGIQYVW